MLISANNPEHIKQAAQIIASGGLVVFPSETVYGLGANACDDLAVAKIFATKQRPTSHPLIVHIAQPNLINEFCNDIPKYAWQLMEKFWPGPLTLILPRKKNIANASASGQNSIGIRCPSHPIAQQLLQQCYQLGVIGVAAPSANKFGKLSPTTGQHVQLEQQILILDAGACEYGIESCIIDCTRNNPVLLRPGVLSIEQIQQAIDIKVLYPNQANGVTPKSSGTLASHYAPRAKVLLLNKQQLQEKLNQPSTISDKIAIYYRSFDITNVQNNFILAKMPNNPLASAKQLFNQLHQFDQMQVAQIWIEQPPDESSWDGVRDRLTRATV